MPINPNESTGNPPSEIAPDEDNTAPIGQGPLQPPAPNAGATNTPETQGTSGMQSSSETPWPESIRRHEHETSELAPDGIMSDAETPRRVLNSGGARIRLATDQESATPLKRPRTSADVNMGAAVNVAIEDHGPENIEAPEGNVEEAPEIGLRIMSGYIEGGVELVEEIEAEDLEAESVEVVAMEEEGQPIPEETNEEQKMVQNQNVNFDCVTM